MESSLPPWRTFSIFISSTFADMQGERDHLKNVVFPRVEEELQQHRIKLEIVDLRWGVDTTSIAQEDEREASVLKVCLDEIRRCRPFFIGLLLRADASGAWNDRIKPEKRSVFLLVFIIHRLHEHDFRANILCDLLNLKFPEMGSLDLDLSARYSNDAVLGRLDALSNFLAFTYIDLHGLVLHATLQPAVRVPCAEASCGSDIPTGLHGLIPFHGDRLH